MNLLSVNQLAAQIKLQETWKALNLPEYPTVMDRVFQSSTDNERQLRTRPNRQLVD